MLCPFQPILFFKAFSMPWPHTFCQNLPINHPKFQSIWQVPSTHLSEWKHCLIVWACASFCYVIMHLPTEACCMLKKKKIVWFYTSTEPHHGVFERKPRPRTRVHWFKFTQTRKVHTRVFLPLVWAKQCRCENDPWSEKKMFSIFFLNKLWTRKL